MKLVWRKQIVSTARPLPCEQTTLRPISIVETFFSKWTSTIHVSLSLSLSTTTSIRSLLYYSLDLGHKISNVGTSLNPNVPWSKSQMKHWSEWSTPCVLHWRKKLRILVLLQAHPHVPAVHAQYFPERLQIRHYYRLFLGVKALLWFCKRKSGVAFSNALFLYSNGVTMSNLIRPTPWFNFPFPPPIHILHHPTV